MGKTTNGTDPPAAPAAGKYAHVHDLPPACGQSLDLRLFED